MVKLSLASGAGELVETKTEDTLDFTDQALKDMSPHQGWCERISDISNADVGLVPLQLLHASTNQSRCIDYCDDHLQMLHQLVTGGAGKGGIQINNYSLPLTYFLLYLPVNLESLCCETVCSGKSLGSHLITYICLGVAVSDTLINHECKHTETPTSRAQCCFQFQW